MFNFTFSDEDFFKKIASVLIFSLECTIASVQDLEDFNADGLNSPIALKRKKNVKENAKRTRIKQ